MTFSIRQQSNEVNSEVLGSFMETQVHSLLKVHQKVSDNKKIEKRHWLGMDLDNILFIYTTFLFHTHAVAFLKFPCLFCLVGGQGWKGVIIMGKKRKFTDKCSDSLSFLIEYGKLSLCKNHQQHLSPSKLKASIVASGGCQCYSVFGSTARNVPF